jgi:hypothetical protein
MTDNRAVVEIEQDTARGLIASERGAVAVSAPTLGATPILLTVAVYSGAVCIGALVSLNMLHWFWRQLQ